MIKRAVIGAIIITLSLGAGVMGLAQEDKGQAKAGPTGGMARRPNFAIIFGSITSIDNSDPAKPKLEVKNAADGSTHKVDLTPWTNITKVTGVSELKTGYTVRIMARKTENAEVAMTVVFGNIKNTYRPMAPRPAAARKAPAPEKTAIK